MANRKKNIDKASNLLKRKFPDMSFALLAVDGDSVGLRAELELSVSQSITMIKSSASLISKLSQTIANNMDSKIETLGETNNG